MTSINSSLAPLAAFVLAALATPAVRLVARWIGAVAEPKEDRWHSKPTAMFGGVAIAVAVIVPLLVWVPQTRESWTVIAATFALFAVGLVDDLFHIKPYQKLIGQLLGASAVVYFGLVLPWTVSPVLNMLLTFFWLVGVTNAVNMLDNMDGLAAGVAAIAAAFLAITFQLNGQTLEAVMLATFCAALVGFLIYNHNPASIFMGDCGSMFIGFFLASTALLSAEAGGGRSRSVFAVLAVPVLILCIPIFDTTFVTLMRKLAGRAASQGGRDHTSHRLVALGLSERHAVWMMYSFAALGGLLALLVRHAELDVSLAAIAAFTLVLTFLGLYLARVRVYSDEEIAAARQKPVISFLVDLTYYKRRVFEVGLDVVLIVFSYYAAYALLFGPASADSGDWQLFLKTLPLIVFVKLATFLAVGVYRGLWRYTSIGDVVVFGKAVLVSSFASVLLIVFAFRFDGFSRTAFFIDGMILLFLVSGSRFAFRTLRRLFPSPHARTGRRVLIFGAGDGGELLYRELNNNSDLACVPVGFVDDDPSKRGKLVHGLPVFSADSIGRICMERNIDEVFLSTAKISPERLSEIVGSCELAGVPVKRLRIEFERIADPEIGWVLPSAESPTMPAGAAPPPGSRLPLHDRPRPNAVSH